MKLALLTTMTIYSIIVRGFTTPSFTVRGRLQQQHTIPLCNILHSSNTKGSSNSNTRITKCFSTNMDNEEQEKKKKIPPPPMTLLSGFLGSGKTTTLQKLLTNNDNIKIGVVVNDVASVNIDSKLLSNPNNNIIGEETIELQNGCACCSLADELLTSVEKLTNNGERDLDHIVIELSGVADPEAVRNNWKNAEMVRIQYTIYNINIIVIILFSFLDIYLLLLLL